MHSTEEELEASIDFEEEGYPDPWIPGGMIYDPACKRGDHVEA